MPLVDDSTWRRRSGRCDCTDCVVRASRPCRLEGLFKEEDTKHCAAERKESTDETRQRIRVGPEELGVAEYGWKLLDGVREVAAKERSVVRASARQILLSRDMHTHPMTEPKLQAKGKNENARA